MRRSYNKHGAQKNRIINSFHKHGNSHKWHTHNTTAAPSQMGFFFFFPVNALLYIAGLSTSSKWIL
jgi:hypothetical protein